MNKTSFLLFFLVVFCVQVNAQVLSRDSVVGVWICEDVIFQDDARVDPVESKERLDIMKKGFKDAKFIFDDDGKMRVKLPLPTQEDFSFAMLMDVFNGEEWSVDPAAPVILIGESKNLAQFELVTKDNSTYFIFVGTPLMLKVKQL